MGIFLLLAAAECVQRLHGKIGWDTEIYCAAVKAFQDGLDPYLINNLGGMELSFVYQPVYLYIIAPLCNLSRIVPIPFMFASSLATVAAVCLWPSVWNRRNASVAAALALGGFSGFAWTLQTGNVSAFELLVLSLAVIAMRARRWTVAAVVLGALGSLKLVSLILLAVVLVADESWSRRVRLLMLGSAAFTAIGLVSAALQPDYMLTWLRQVAGGIEGQHAPITEFGDLSNPSMIFLLGGIIGATGYAPVSLLLYGLAFLTVSGVTAFIAMWREKGVPDPDLRIGFALLVLILFMFRLKPYSLLMTSLPVWMLAMRLQTSGRIAVVFLATAGPMVWEVLSRVIFEKDGFLWHYQQPLLLSAVLCLLLILYCGPLACSLSSSPPVCDDNTRASKF